MCAFLSAETGSYICEFCGKQYKYFNPYQEHVALHTPMGKGVQFIYFLLLKLTYLIACIYACATIENCLDLGSFDMKASRIQECGSMDMTKYGHSQTGKIKSKHIFFLVCCIFKVLLFVYLKWHAAALHQLTTVPSKKCPWRSVSCNIAIITSCGLPDTKSK